ncbi:hypothetical protein PMAYCL1PPCAC_32879, partial [Pristionchus mayeri]
QYRMHPSDEITPNREDVIDLLRKNGETIDHDAPFSFSRLGEGRGFCSLLFSVHIDKRSYAVKISDPRSAITGTGWNSGTEGERARSRVRRVRMGS